MKYTDEEMLAELKRVAAIVDGPLSRPKYLKCGPRISAAAISVRFGGWLSAVKRAGLDPAYKYGGIWFDCPICGRRFRSGNGKKARRTCSKKCTGRLMSRQRSRGDDASKQAARGRASNVVRKGRCERCGHDGSIHRLECHHRDKNVYNNAHENIEVLCISCHKKTHPRERNRPTTQERLILEVLARPSRLDLWTSPSVIPKLIWKNTKRSAPWASPKCLRMTKRGWLRRTSRGQYKLTDAGRAHLVEIGVVAKEAA